MNLRPAAVRWFETYVPRDQTVWAVEALAQSGVVQLEMAPRAADAVDVDKLHYFISRFRELAVEHARALPAASRQATALVGDPVHIANQALHRLRVWSARLDYLTQRLSQLHAEREQLLLLAECLEALQSAGYDVEGIFRQTPFLTKYLLVCPAGEDFAPELKAAAEVAVRGPSHNFVYIAALPEHRPSLQEIDGGPGGCRQVALPFWLAGDRGPGLQQLRAQQAANVRETDALEAERQALETDAGMAEARANVQTLHWYMEHAARHLTQGGLCHVTGWTSTPDPHRLQQALQVAGIDAVIRFPHAPATAVAPVALLDTWWTRPFQPLLQMWGTPGRTEVDPSGLLAILVPLLFGYMFPDVGHGALLVVLALVYSRRWPRIRFLLPCGVSAMGFGWIFGDVFGFHDIIAPLWLKPLDHPVDVLAVPLLFGAGVTLLGLIFAAIEARWRGQLRQWLMVDAAVLLLYASVLVGLFLPQAYAVAALALLHYLVGSAVLATGQRLLAVLSAAGRLLLSMFELTMNTLSFLRVGAFALSHAALSSAVMSFADAADSAAAWFLIVLAGNLFAMVMEGLLVFVQTTRLVLFEFFIRFLQAEGRLFRPLGPPQRPPSAA